MRYKEGNQYWKLRKRSGFIKGKKNPKLSEKRKQMFKEGLLNNSGENNGMFGKNHSEEAKEKLKNNKHMLGKKHTEKTKEKIKVGHLGKKLSEEHKNKLGLKGKLNPMFGKKHSDESIIKIKEARKNQKNVYESKIEVKVQNFLKKMGIEYFTHQYMKIEHGYQCDILIPSLNLVIECDGNYWHKYPIGKDIDHVRTNELIEKGFRVLRLWENEIKTMNINEFKNKLQEVN